MTLAAPALSIASPAARAESDTQSGGVTWANALSVLTPFEFALKYWSGLNAPVEVVAAALRTTPEAITAGYRALAGKPLSGPETFFTGVAGYPSTKPWQDRTAAKLVRRALLQRSDEQMVFVSGQGALTGTDVRASVARIIAGLQAHGVQKGQRVAVDASQRIESYLVILACLVLGAEIAPMTLSNGIMGVRYLLSVAPARITFSELAQDLAGDANAGTCVDLSGSARPGTGFSDWLNNHHGADDLPDFGVAPTDVALLNSTSGSTGKPKLIQVQQGAIYRNAEAFQTMFVHTPQDIICSPSDLSATFRNTIMMPLICGGKVVLPSAEARQQPLALAEDCYHFGVTHLTVVPNVLRGLVKAKSRLRPDCFRSLKTAFSSAAPLDKQTRDAFADAFGKPVMDVFGSRETFATLCSHPGRAETVLSGGGRICNAAIAIVDDEGRGVAPGQIGEIMIHSDSIARSGISEDRPEWAGWHQTGDLGKIKSDGTVQISGRKRDVIKGGDGSMIFPAQIEALLNAMPAVRESCVLGWTGKNASEHVIACVVLIEEQEDFESEARKTIMASAGRFSVPARIFVVKDFKRVALQKIDKARLRAELADQLTEL